MMMLAPHHMHIKQDTQGFAIPVALFLFITSSLNLFIYQPTCVEYGV